MQVNKGRRLNIGFASRTSTLLQFGDSPDFRLDSIPAGSDHKKIAPQITTFGDFLS
jgi:hypothetical protein